MKLIYSVRYFFVMLFTLLFLSLAFAGANYKQLVTEIENRLDHAASLYQQQHVTEAKTTISNAYFEIFENLEGPIRINISAAKSYELEAIFGEIRKMMTDSTPLDQVQKRIAELKQGLNDVLPTLEQGTKLEGHTTTNVAGNPKIAQYWQDNFKVIVDNLELAIREYRANNLVGAKQAFDNAYNEGYVKSQMQAFVQQFSSADARAAIDNDWKTLQSDVVAKGKINHFSYYTVVLQQDLEEQLINLATPNDPAAGNNAQAANTGIKDEGIEADWEAVAASVDQGIAQAIATYEQDKSKAKETIAQVQNTYFDVFEGSGFENRIGARDVNFKSQLEGYFTRIVSLMNQQAPVSDLNDQRVGLKVDMTKAISMVQNNSPWFLFISAFLILLREGLEALLIVAAIIAYLAKNNHNDKIKSIAQSVLVAIAASIVTAILFQLIFTNAGRSRELLEGFTMFIAVFMLSPMAYWLLSKIEGNNWKLYIQGKLSDALTTGSLIGLWLTSFFAVYREGAETVLFYFALVGDVSHPSGYLYLFGGLAAAVVVLAICYFVMRYSIVKLPLKPFFLVTGLFMYLMAFVFAGKGVIELIEGKLFSPHLVAGAPEIPWLGMYPYIESIVCQLIVIAMGVVGYFVLKHNAKKNAQKLA